MASRATFVFAVLFALPAMAQTRPSVLLASDDANGDALATALSVELAGVGYMVLRGPSPQGVTPLERAAMAQQAARVAGAQVTIWVESGPEGGALLRAVDVDGEATRHAPLPAPLATMDARTFAVVASSLVDEIRTPPTRFRVRVQVSVQADGAEVDTANVRVATNDGREASAELNQPLIIEVPVEAIEVPVEEAPVQPVPVEMIVEAPADQPRKVLFGIDFAPYIGSSSWARGRDTRTMSLGLAGSYSRAIEGVGLSAGINLTREHTHGTVLAGLGNIAGGDVEGAQLAGGFNIARGELQGIQAAGGFNLHLGNVRGAQFAGGLNIATGRVDGLQVSGGVNYAVGGRGAQLGLVNIQRGPYRGVQVGLLNISDDADFALGLINIVRQGRTHLELSATTDGFVFGMVKHGGPHWHYLYSVGGRALSDGNNEPVYSLGLGLGAHLTPHSRVFIDLEGLVHYLSDGDYGDNGTEALGQLRLMVGVKIMDRLALLGGLAYNVLGTYNDDSSYASAGETVLAERSTECIISPCSNDWRVTGWPSLILGIQFL